MRKMATLCGKIVFWDDDRGCETWFGDVEDRSKPRYGFFLFYDIGGKHTFHTPIEAKDVEGYNLPIVDIGKLETYGDDIVDLLSNQFVNKVLALIEQNNYQYVLTIKEVENDSKFQSN